MAAPDPGLAALAAERPCTTRRQMIEAGQAGVFPDFGFFPLDGQYIDTPSGVTPRRTSDTPS